jgi:hypothetical protein
VAALAIVPDVLVKDFTSGGPQAAGTTAERTDADGDLHVVRRRVTLGAVYRIGPSDGSRRTIGRPASAANHVRVPSR